jgi:hypothetical protein
MASTATAVANTATPYAVDINVGEDGLAAAPINFDVLAALTAAGFNATNSPLFAGLNAPFANAAAAQAYLDQNCDLISYFTASSVGTTTITYNGTAPGGAVAGTFRLTINGVKAAGADTATGKCRITLRHSIVR